MAKDASFDIVSKVDMQELDNAVNQTKKEISQRFDFKGSPVEITTDNDSLKIIAESDFKIDSVIDILKGKMIKRNIPARNLSYEKAENASGGNKRLEVKIQNGISKEKAKELTTHIKNMKLKVQAQILDDTVRISAAKKDDLQAVMQELKSKDFGIELQFINYR